MEDYVNKGKEVLRILINNGFEAYFVGKMVRNKIMQLPIDEIEINTNATPDAIKGIFSFTKVEDAKNGLIKVMYSGYDFFLSTFHLEEYKDRRTPVRIHYSKNLLDDLSSRDFSINAMVMSHSDKITDAYRGVNDINRKRIKTIGKAKVRFSENPLRILKAIGLVSELNFKLVRETRKAIRSKSKLLRDVASEDVALEIKNIFKGKYFKKAFKLMNDLHLNRHLLPLKKGFNYLRYRNFNLTYEEFLLVAFVLNSRIDEGYLNTVNDIEAFKKAFQLALANPKSKYSRLDLFSNGLEVCLLANKINVILKRGKKRGKKISFDYQSLPIKKVCDLAFKGEDILKLHPDNADVQVIIDQVIYEILEGSLINDYDSVKNFVIDLMKKMNINIKEEVSYNYENPDLKDLSKDLEYNKLVNATSEDDLKASLTQQGQVIKDYTEHRIDMLEKRLNEQARLLQEKDQKYEALLRETRRRQIQEDVDDLVNKNLEMLKKMNYLNNPEKDKVELSRQLNRVYMSFINDMEDRYTNNEVKDEEN